jgi:hypothetical protein
VVKPSVLTLLPFLSIGVACNNNEGTCVAAGTPVDTPAGPRPIEEIAVGDAVLSIEPDTGELRPTQVTAIRSAERECVRLLLSGGRSLVCTGDHPLYDPEARRFAPATDWIDGLRRHLAVRVQGGLQTVELEGHDRYVGVHRVFDLTVETPLHNFIAGGCLVHNKDTYDSVSCFGGYEYNEQGECVMLSTTGIADTVGDTATDDAGTSGVDSGSGTGTTSDATGSSSGGSGSDATGSSSGGSSSDSSTGGSGSSSSGTG